MGSPLLTGSGVERAAICLASAVLPRTETRSDDANRGHVIHAYLQAVNEHGREAALALVPDDMRAACEAIDLSRLPVDPSRFAAEVAFAFDTATGKARELGRGIGRRYECSPTEVAGTSDVIALLDDDAVLVDDYKSGWSRRPRASESLQLRFYALAGARAYGRSRAVVRLTRIMEDGEVWVDEAALDAFDLDSFAADLGALASQIEEARKLYAEGVEPDMAEGAHCRWCPAFSRCPAKCALLAADPACAAITPEGAARAYERIKLHRQALDAAEEILRDYARANPIPLPDGTVYGVRLDSTKRLDGKVAAAALRDLLGPAAEAAIEIDVTQASIKRAIKGTAHTLEEALAAIKARGGLRTVESPKLVCHKPKKEAA
jgi:hypothetical protein